MAGQYGYGITITGEEEHKSCLASLTVTSSLSVSCPDDITNQNPSNAINVTASASNCGEGCSYKIFDAGSDNERTSSSDPSLSFYDVNGTGTKSYKLQAMDSYGNKSSCTFKVSFASAQSSAAVASSNSHSGKVIELKYNGNWQTFNTGKHTIKCIKNKDGNTGHLVCQCPILDGNYNNCTIIYNNDKKTTLMYNQTVDGDGADKCGNMNQVTIEVLPPITGNGKKTQPDGIQCMSGW